MRSEQDKLKSELRDSKENSKYVASSLDDIHKVKHSQPSDESVYIEDTIKHFKEFSLLLYKLSNEYENHLNQALSNQNALNFDASTKRMDETIHLLNLAIERFDTFTQQATKNMTPPKKRRIKSFAIRISRFIFRVVRKTVTMLGLTKLIKRSKLYRNLFTKGVIEKLKMR